jgi:hypothetical protein
VQVFVFGNYDSRGGTTAIAAPDRQTAMCEYARVSWLDDLGYSKAEQREFVETDYLGPADLFGALPDGADGVDLEWGLEGAVFCRATTVTSGRDGEDRARWAESDAPIELLYVAHPERDDDEVPVPPAGYWHPRWDDDEYGFVLVNSYLTTVTDDARSCRADSQSPTPVSSREETFYGSSDGAGKRSPSPGTSTKSRISSGGLAPNHSVTRCCVGRRRSWRA